MPPVLREVHLILSGVRDFKQLRLAARSVPQTCIKGLLMSQEVPCVKPSKEGSVGLIPEIGTEVLSPETPKTRV